MWLKFDGTSAYVKLNDDEANLFKIVKFPITIDMWVHISEGNGKLYIDGKEKEAE